MTNTEALKLKPGDKVIYDNEKWIICYVKQVRHTNLCVAIKMRRGTTVIWLLSPEKLTKYQPIKG